MHPGTTDNPDGQPRDLRVDGVQYPRTTTAAAEAGRLQSKYGAEIQEADHVVE